ncbi:hypothetical protein [Leifsonia sp. C5G2]|uniref:hypothetical protein n=1 Tax=Leifsonia sp. C5G2 TaxID=2735269 RepID=UPI001584839E|nr:hypothetical protein [Leifsonia sp. C5G2]NUU05101.1 hypothetical protein [Leifsonia sp. C5G2]
MMPAASGVGALGRLAATLAIVCGIAGTASGCSTIESRAVSQEETTKVNLANQRRAAVMFRREYRNPELKAIRFMREGGRPGLGAPWGVNARITIGDQHYEEVLQLDSWAGEQLPPEVLGDELAGVVVTYSDGASEVLNDNR